MAASRPPELRLVGTREERGRTPIVRRLPAPRHGAADRQARPAEEWRHARDWVTDLRTEIHQLVCRDSVHPPNLYAGQVIARPIDLMVERGAWLANRTPRRPRLAGGQCEGGPFRRR